jgi:hypothetical protein
MDSSAFSWGKFCYMVQQDETCLALDRIPPIVQANWERAAQAILLLLGERIQFLEKTIQDDPDLDSENVEFTLALLEILQGILAEPPRASDVNRCKATLDTVALDTETSSPSNTTASEGSASAMLTCRRQEDLVCSSCVSPMARTAPPPP